MLVGVQPVIQQRGRRPHKELIPVILQRGGVAVLILVQPFAHHPVGEIVAEFVILQGARRPAGVDGVDLRVPVAVVIQEAVVQPEGKIARLQLDGVANPVGRVIFRRRLMIKLKVRRVAQGQGLQGVRLAQQRGKIEAHLRGQPGHPGRLGFEAVARDQQHVVVIAFLDPGG